MSNTIEMMKGDNMRAAESIDSQIEALKKFVHMASWHDSNSLKFILENNML